MSDPQSCALAKMIMFVLSLAVTCGAAYFVSKYAFSQLDPTKKKKEKARKTAEDKLKRAGVRKVELNEYEMVIASNLIVPEDIPVSWADIAGHDEVIQELIQTLIIPIQNRELLASCKLVQPPKGILLHGPPGCGKTLIAKATARESKINFINLDFSDLTDKWYGESQKLTSAVFSLAKKIQPCIIFIDEIDSLLRTRNHFDHEVTAIMKAQFLSLWDGLNTDPNSIIVVMGATNRPQDIDKAIIRRMSASFYISLPNVLQRQKILNLILKGELIEKNIDLYQLAELTGNFSGSDLQELCRSASIYRLCDYVRLSTDMSQDLTVVEKRDKILRPISMNDLLTCLKKMRKSLKNTAEVL